MKNVGRTTKRSLLYLGFLSLSLFVIHSCDNGNPDDTKEIAEDQNEERFDDRNLKKMPNSLLKLRLSIWKRSNWVSWHNKEAR